jgi:hypothetical protein
VRKRPVARQAEQSPKGIRRIFGHRLKKDESASAWAVKGSFSQNPGWFWSDLIQPIA